MTNLVPNTAPPAKRSQRLPAAASGASKPSTTSFRESSRSSPATPAVRSPIPPTGRSATATPAMPKWCASPTTPRSSRFGDLLDVFFVIHDPTQLNRQGNDVGTQYRSAVFYHNAEQKRIAQEKIAALAGEGVYDDRIVTEVDRGRPVLCRGGLPPGVLRQQPLPGLLHGGGRAEGGQIPQAFHRQAQAQSLSRRVRGGWLQDSATVQGSGESGGSVVDPSLRVPRTTSRSPALIHT